MILDSTTEPPTIRLNEWCKREWFSLLQPMNSLGNGDDREYVYDVPALVELTRNLMARLCIPYDAHTRPDEPLRELADFSEEERRLYYPFAFMLACLAGNAFRTGQLNAILENPQEDSPETISQYIPDAYRIITANSGTLAEVRTMITQAVTKAEPLTRING